MLKLSYAVLIQVLFLSLLIRGCTLNAKLQSQGEASNQASETVAEENNTKVFEGWGPRMFSGKANTDSQQADYILDQVISALEAKDINALKLLFSSNTLQTVTNLDDQLSSLFAFYEGTCTSHERKGLSTSMSKNNGIQSKETNVSYDINTTSALYRIAIQFVSVDTEDAQNIGITSLYMILAEDSDMQFSYWGGHEWKSGIVIESATIAGNQNER